MLKGTNTLKLQALLISVRSSFWFLPALAVLASAGLAMLMVEADKRFGQIPQQQWPQFFAMDAEGARSILSAIASSIATIAGVAFSITIVALVLASSQYTSRILRTFMRDRSTQLVLGVFVGVYVYCLLILHTLAGSKGEFVPSLAVFLSVALAVVAIGFFIFFIHHISSSIQASDITAEITRETLDVVSQVFPERYFDDKHDSPPEDMEKREWHSIPVKVMGYIQTINLDALIALAEEHEVILKMDRGVGDFVAPHLPMLSFSGADSFKGTATQSLEQLYAVDTSRTIEQDPRFGIRQLVDIAIKALSPGINDTTTAVTCIQHLSVILAHIAQRQMPSPLHRDGRGSLRVIAKEPEFGHFVALAFNQIIENAEGNTEILVRLLDAIAQIAVATRSTYRRNDLNKWVATIDEVAQRSAKSSHAMHEIKEHIRIAKETLKAQ